MSTTDARNPTFLIENTGHASLRLFSPNNTYDQFISFGRRHPETFAVDAWCIGLDSSAAKFRIMQRASSAEEYGTDFHTGTARVTPSSGDTYEVASFTASGLFSIGLVQDAGSAADKFLIISDNNNGIVGYRTAAGILSDIGATTMTGSTANGILTYNSAGNATVESSATINGNTLTMTGTATEIDLTKTSSAATTGVRRCMDMNFDADGDVQAEQITTNVIADFDLDSSGTSNHANGVTNNYGLDIDLVAGTSGTQTNYGIDLNISGADSNYGIFLNVTDGHTDYKSVSSADTGDFYYSNHHTWSNYFNYC